jgi:hypothetical protein
MSNPFRSALSLIQQYRREFVVLNAVFFGLFLSSMLLTTLRPSLQPVVIKVLSVVVRTDMAAEIYLSGNILLAAGATFLVNFGVAVLLISLLSFFVPFFGVLFAFVFAAVYGITLAPIGPHAAAMIPHSIAVLIEFEAYIIAALGSYIIGRSTGYPLLRSGLLVGLSVMDGIKKVVTLYTLIIPLLLVGALYEAFEIIMLVKYFV